jgi:RNA polymerase sigma-70 factor (ECF subfamily)
MNPDSSLARFRSYLVRVARLRLGNNFRNKVDPSSVVQETLVRAQENAGQFRGGSEAERLAWLRQILVRKLADAIRALGREKRNVALERSLDAAGDSSAPRWQDGLPANDTSPSRRAEQNEQLDRLAQALAELPEDQRQAVVLHHLQKATLAESAAQMGRSRAAVGGLLHRGLETLRKKLREEGES